MLDSDSDKTGGIRKQETKHNKTNTRSDQNNKTRSVDQNDNDVD